MTMAGMAALELETKLMRILRENDTVFTKDLARQLSPFTKNEISRQLNKYQKDGIVDRVSQTPAAWILKGKNIDEKRVTRRMDCQEISKRPRPDPPHEDIEEQVLQYLKKKTEPLKVAVIARALKISNDKKVTTALIALKKHNLVKSEKEGRANTWMVNWNVVVKDEEESDAEQAATGAEGCSREVHSHQSIDEVNEGDGNGDSAPDAADIKQEMNDSYESQGDTAQNDSLNDSNARPVHDIKPDQDISIVAEEAEATEEIADRQNFTNTERNAASVTADAGSNSNQEFEQRAPSVRMNLFAQNVVSSEFAESNDQEAMDVDATDNSGKDASDSQIMDSILVCLAKTPNGRLMVKEIIKRVGAQRKKDINRHLYGMKKSGLLEHLQQVPPVWGITPKGREAAKKCAHTPAPTLFGKQKQPPPSRFNNQLDNKGIPMSPMRLLQQQNPWSSSGTVRSVRSPELPGTRMSTRSSVSSQNGQQSSIMPASTSNFGPSQLPSLMDVTVTGSATGGRPFLGIGRGHVMTVPKPVGVSLNPQGLSSGGAVLGARKDHSSGDVADPSSSLYPGQAIGARCAARFPASGNDFSSPASSSSEQPQINPQGHPTSNTIRPSTGLGGFNKPFQAPRPQSGAVSSRLPSGPPPSPMELLQSDTVFAAPTAPGKRVNVTNFGPLNVSNSVRSDSLISPGTANKVNAPGFGPIKVSPITTPDSSLGNNPFMAALQRPQLMSINPSNSLPSGSTNVLESGSIPQLDMAALSSDSFAALNKNPISALMEYAQSRKMTASIEMLGQAGPSHNPKFRIAVRVGNRLFQEVIARNKKDGRRDAADVALRTLISEGQYQATQSSKNNLVERVQKLGLKITFFDRMAAMAHHAFNTLVAMVADSMSGRKVLAAMVMKRSPNEEGEVISVGTGNRCIEGIYLSLEGKTVNDSHAEIITRRGFIRFVYNNLLTHHPGTTGSLFEGRMSSRKKLILKPGISFHLYISTAPCGDGALFSPTDVDNGPMSVDENMDHDPIFTSQIQGVLRTKVERGEGTIPIEPDFKSQTWDGILRGERLRTMSCSDKICRWNILGMQGALLSYFLEPVYLDSLTLGYLYVHGHLSRAVCCRLDNKEPDVTSSLPAGYKVNHPKLGRVTAYDPPRETEKTTSGSMNWIVGDTRPEVTDGTKGCMDSRDQRVSQISKLRLYALFKDVCHKYNRADLMNADSYHAAKNGAIDFQGAKTLMNLKFKKSYKSTWVSKPPEEEMFS